MKRWPWERNGKREDRTPWPTGRQAERGRQQDDSILSGLSRWEDNDATDWESQAEGNQGSEEKNNSLLSNHLPPHVATPIYLSPPLDTGRDHPPPPSSMSPEQKQRVVLGNYRH